VRRLVATLVATAALLTLGAAPANADSIRNRQYWLSEYRISEAWAVTKGAGVTIAVIDTGVDGTHLDLGGAVVGGADFSGHGSADGQTPVGSSNDHGTMVASLAAGRGHGDGAGILGAAPEASILAISIGFDAAGDDSDAQIADAVRWAADNGADVINMSLTRNTLDWPESWDDAFLYAMEKDVVIIAAAGNRGSGTTVVGAPATMPGVLTVAGVDRRGTASFDASSQGITIGVAAPSEELVGATPGDGYVLWDGTSGASPIVAGVAALVRAAHPELSATDVINRIVSTARPAGAAGVDPIYGYGLLDAAAAVTATVPHVAENPMGSLADWIVLYRRADAPPVSPPTAAQIPAPESSPIAPDAGVTGSLLPTVAQLRDVGIPLLVIVVFSSTFLMLVVAAVRHFRGLRATR
jgi:type VII secretion-associated serine protease mycosin